MLELFLFFNMLTLKLIQKCYVMHAGAEIYFQPLRVGSI